MKDKRINLSDKIKFEFVNDYERFVSITYASSPTKIIKVKQMITLYFILKSILKRNSFFKRLFSYRSIRNENLSSFIEQDLDFGYRDVLEHNRGLYIGCQKIPYRKIKKLVKLMEENF